MGGIGVNHFATFRFEDPAAAPKAHGRSVRDFAAGLHRGLDLPSAKPDAPFGDEELSIFSVGFGDAEFNVGVSAKGPNSDEIWELHVQLPHPAFFRKAREAQLGTMRRLDEALHRQLLALGAQDLRWFVQDKRGDAGQAEP
jgi:hypothetical protein